MKIDPMDQWCSECGSVGHSEPSCPYRECDACEGTGTNENNHAQPCGDCKGRGYVYER